MVVVVVVVVVVFAVVVFAVVVAVAVVVFSSPSSSLPPPPSSSSLSLQSSCCRRLVVAASILSAFQSAIASAIGGLRPSDVVVTSAADTSVDVTVYVGLIGSSPTVEAIEATVASPAFITSVNAAGTGVDLIAVSTIRSTRLFVSPPPPQSLALLFPPSYSRSWPLTPPSVLH